MSSEKNKYSRALKELSSNGDPRVLLIEQLGFEHARQQIIDQSRWYSEWKEIIHDARFIAEKSGFRVALVVVKENSPAKIWRSIASRIIVDYNGLALVCIHSSSGQRWLWSSSSLSQRRTAAALLEGVRHFTVEINVDGTAPRGFLSLLSKIDMTKAKGDLDVLAIISSAFDTYTMDLQSDIGTNVYEAMRIFTEGLLAFKENGLGRRQKTIETIRPDVFILMYRFLFVFYSESRGVFPVDHPIYFEEYSMAWWRDNVVLPFEKDGKNGLKAVGGPRGTELWERCRRLFHLIMTGSVYQGHNPKEFEFRPYYGTIFDSELHENLEKWAIQNECLADALRALIRFEDVTGSTYFVDYASLEIRHLGSIYERLLEYHLTLNESGNVVHTADELERKSTGSYYTPDSLIRRLVSNTVGPILNRIQDEVGSGNHELFERRVYSLRICDPAMGSGHFLVGVIDYLARAILEYRESAGISCGEEEFVEIKRELVRRSIYGVDRNPLAVELAKMSLWLETLNSNRPLSFLDAHLKTGNSIVGAWFKSLSDPQRSLIDSDIRDHIVDEIRILMSIERKDELHSVDVQNKVRQYRELRSANTRYGRLMRLLDAQIVQYFGINVPDWRAARELLKDSKSFDALTTKLPWKNAMKISQRVCFFHWELEFPEVFFGEDGSRLADSGFDIVVGNPPWNKIKFLDKEFFKYRSPEIARAQTAAKRRDLIERLRKEKSPLMGEYDDAREDAEFLSKYLRESGQYPHTATGDINYYPIFVERSLKICRKAGYMGMITPTGLVSDYGNQGLLSSLVQSGRLRRVDNFENKGIFQDIHNQFKFSLVVVSGCDAEEPVRVASYLRDPMDADDPAKWYELRSDSVRQFNPNTGTLPLFRSRKDAELNEKMYRTAGSVLLDETMGARGNPWAIKAFRMFDMTNDSGLFHTRSELEPNGWKLKSNLFVKGPRSMVPLYEAKMVHLWNPRYATYHDASADDIRKGLCREATESELADPNWEPLPRYWVDEMEVRDYWKKRSWDNPWILVFRDITNATNERTSIVSFAPLYAYGNKLPGLLVVRDVRDSSILVANMSSMPFDYCARSKVAGTNMNFFVLYQLPVLPPMAYDQWELDGKPVRDRISWLCLTLACTSKGLRSLADKTFHEPRISKWDFPARFEMMRELDAIYAMLYDLTRDEFSTVLDSFPIVRETDIRTYGSFRTKDRCLALYDSLNGRLIRK